MKKLLPVAAAAFALAGGHCASQAATPLGEYFTFSGFGTLGGVQTDSNEGTFGKDRQNIGGANKTARFDVDSNLGLQLTGTATSWLSGTVQVLASKRDKGHVEPEVEWAFVTVKPIDGLTARAGRMAAPMFAVSDSRNVGYANTWVRAPNEVYALNVFRAMRGFDITYRQPVGAVAISATAFGGNTDFKALGGFDAKGDDLKGLNLQLEADWATFRFGKATTDVSVPSLGTAGGAYDFTGFGITVDRDELVGQAEYVQRRSESQGTVVDADGWYVLGGWRFGALLPYVIVSQTKPKTAGSPAYVSAEQETKAIGLRWDAFSSAAIKVQIDRIDTKDSKGISFTTPLIRRPGAPPTSAPILKPVTALSVVVDFTF